MPFGTGAARGECTTLDHVKAVPVGSTVGLAIGALLIELDDLTWSAPNLRSYAIRYVIPIAAGFLLIWLGWFAVRRQNRPALLGVALGLLVVALYLAIRSSPWSTRCLTDPGMCNWSAERYVEFAAGWMLVLGTLTGAAAIGLWAIFRGASARWYQQAFGGAAVGLSVGTILLAWTLEERLGRWGTWYALGVIALMLGAGYASSHMPIFAWLAGIALITAAFFFMAYYVAGTAMGCAISGSCGWTAWENLLHWFGPILVAAAMIACAAAVLLRVRQESQPQPV